MAVPVYDYPVVLPGSIPIYRGDPWSHELALKDSNGAAVDLSGFGTAWSAQLRWTVDTTAYLALTVDATHAADPTDPHLTVSLTGTQTAALVQESYVFDVQATNGSSLTVFRGDVEMTKDVTR